MVEPGTTQENLTEAQKEFLAAPLHIQELVKRIIEEERKVRHMLRRPVIHESIVNHVKQAVR